MIDQPGLADVNISYESDIKRINHSALFLIMASIYVSLQSYIYSIELGVYSIEYGPFSS